jgi:hypothetical protein
MDGLMKKLNSNQQEKNNIMTDRTEKKEWTKPQVETLAVEETNQLPPPEPGLS